MPGSGRSMGHRQPGGAGWTRLEPAGPGWSRLDPVGPGWPAGPGWSRLDPAGPGWSRLEPVGAGWSRLEPVGAGWSRLAPVFLRRDFYSGLRCLAGGVPWLACKPAAESTLYLSPFPLFVNCDEGYGLAGAAHAAGPSNPVSKQ